MKRCLFFSMLALLAPAGASATGLLIPADSSLGPLGIKYHRAEAKITDRVAVTKVDQAFYNHTDRDLEATYVFPLPKGATVSDFYLYMNGKKQKGEVLERDKARSIYEGIVRRMQDPGLLEYLGRDLFQARVYPVPRRGEARIEIEFTQLMPFAGGVINYSYPMRTDRTSARIMKDFTMTVQIKSQTPIKAIYSPSHEIYSRKRDDHHASAGFEKTAALLDRDFDLFYSVSEKDIGLNLLTYREPGEPGFFLLMVSPKSDYTEKEIIGKRVTFVIDTSGSMSGAAMRHAKAALKYCLNKLNPDDLFNVIRFSTDVESFSKKPVSASRENVQRALNFTKRMEAAGGTAIDEALAAALAGHQNAQEPNLIVFLTDGHPTVGETDPRRIAARVKRANKVSARLFVFGVGQDINTRLLDTISSENLADSTYVKPGQEIETTLAAFYDKVSHPVLSDLKLDFGEIHEYDLMPRRLGDLFKGSQLIALGRYRDDGHSALTLSGSAGNRERRFVFEGQFPKTNRENDFIPRLWATRKIGFLLDNIRLGGEKPELVDEIVQLSKRYGIVTPYTSYLVTEDQAVATPQPLQPRPRPHQPVYRPRPGWGGEGTRAGAAGDPAQEQARTTAMPAPSPRATRARERYQSYEREKKGVVRADTGQTAVDFAGAVKCLKTAEGDRADEDDAAGIRHVSGRSFRYQSGGWVDLDYQPNMQILKIKYLGRAYFELIQKSPRLKKIFALGERVVVVVGSNRAIAVSPDGQDSVSASELEKFTP